MGDPKGRPCYLFGMPVVLHRIGDSLDANARVGDGIGNIGKSIENHDRRVQEKSNPKIGLRRIIKMPMSLMYIEYSQ